MATWTDRLSTPLQRKFSLLAFAAPALFVVFVLLSCEARGQQPSEPPSWMNGTSTWTGDGYQAPNAATVEPRPAFSVELPSSGPTVNPYANDASPRSYNVPSDPYGSSSGAVPSSMQSGVATTSATLEKAKRDSEFIQQAIAKTIPLDTSTDVVAQVAHQGSPTLGSRMAQATSFERPPLIEESIQWYQYPWRWMTQGWTNSIELGLDGSKGNAETLALQTGAELKRKTDVYTLALDFDYRLANTRDVVTEDNGRFNIDYDRLLGGSPWSLFGKFGLEWDEFKAFDLRLNLNSGLGYHWIRNDRSTFVTRFGAGASREIGAPDDDWVPEAVFGFDAEHQVNKRNKLKAKLDYFPSWEDFSNYRIVSDASWELLLSDDDSLSLKLAATDRYDSTPQGGNKANDVYYSLLLLVKF